MKCTTEQYENELQAIPFPFNSEDHQGVVIYSVPVFCNCSGWSGTITTPPKGMVREFFRCIEFDYAVFCSDCKTTRSFICRYYPADKIWKMKYQDLGWVNIIDMSSKSWRQRFGIKLAFLIMIAGQMAESIKNSPGNKIVHGVVLISKLCKSAFQRHKR